MHAARDLERAERAAELLLLLVGNLGVADSEYTVAGHGILDERDQVSRWRNRQVGTDKLGGEKRM